MLPQVMRNTLSARFPPKASFAVSSQDIAHKSCVLRPASTIFTTEDVDCGVVFTINQPPVGLTSCQHIGQRHQVDDTNRVPAPALPHPRPPSPLPCCSSGPPPPVSRRSTHCGRAPSSWLFAWPFPRRRLIKNRVNCSPTSRSVSTTRPCSLTALHAKRWRVSSRPDLQRRARES
jgi:hypothetical protein